MNAAALEENEKVRDALLASLSHDLRTPLASITGAATTLRAFGDKMSPSERLDLLASIEEEAARLARFVANLLDMSRIEAGGLKVKRDLVSIAEVVRGAVERSRKAFPGQPVRVSLAPNLPFVRGDAKLLEQVLFNLLDNAQKYGGDAGATVHARQEGAEVVISVTDEGPGVKPADLERIFEKFYRGGRADGRKAGTGLGLSICRGLVEAMGGTIDAQSPAVRRRGTRIVMRLPAAQATAAEPRPPHERAARSGGRRRAADPAVSQRRAERRRLYEVQTAETGARRCGWPRPPRPTSSCSTSACPTWTARTSCATSGSSRRRRSSSFRRAIARRRRSRRSISAPTIMSKSPSPSAN